MRTIIAAGLLVAALTARGADLKVGFVDLDRTFDEYYKTKVANVQLQDQADAFKAERKKLIDDYKKASADYDAAVEDVDNPALSDEARDKRRHEADDKLSQKRDLERQIRQYDESKQKQLDEQTRAMRKKILGEIRQSLDGFAKDQGYTMILDESGDSLNGVPSVVFYDKTLDITDAFLPILNKGQTAPAASSAATPAKDAKAKVGKDAKQK